MSTRRDLIVGGLCLASAGAAYGLKPRKRLKLLGDAKMASILPQEFGAWASQSTDELVKPQTEGRLAAMLYSELVARVYVNREDGDEVMMLVAYGDTQSDLLQLHRPESCYPAVGFELLVSEPLAIPLAAGVTIPGRRVLAQRSDYRESILYWARLGEYLPSGAGEQRSDLLKTSLAGFVADGALFRFSTARQDALAFGRLESFVRDLLMSVDAGSRRALVGTSLANALKGAS